MDYTVVYDTSGHRVVCGEETYCQIHFGQRVAFVKASDVNARWAD